MSAITAPQVGSAPDAVRTDRSAREARLTWVVEPGARQRGVAEDGVLHAVAHPLRTCTDQGDFSLVMVIGPAQRHRPGSRRGR